MMKKPLALLLLIVFIVSGCATGNSNSPSSNNQSTTRTIVDMAGRTIEIPIQIDSIYSTSSVGTVFLYTLVPHKLTGWNSQLHNQEKSFIKPKYHDLPVLGTWRGSSTTGNIEELLKVMPDLIISMGDVSDKYISDADSIQSQLNIPVIMLDGSLENIHKSYELMGELLGEEEKARELANYCLEAVESVREAVAKIPEEQRIRLYYAQGPHGLETEPKGSINAEALDFSGAVNIADPGNLEVRRMQATIEQILVWNPDIIIVSSDGDERKTVFNNIKKDRSWGMLTAVQNNEVFEIPSSPYDWINRPPSVARIIGLKWLTNLMYPGYYPIDIKEQVKDFYLKFYDHELSEDEVNNILKDAIRN